MKKIGLIFVFTMLGWFVPALVFASTLYFSPSSGSFGVGSTFTVTLKTNTQNQAVNSAEARVAYSQDTLELIKVSAGGTFSLQTPGSPGKSGSEAFFSGGIPSPGYTGSGGVVGVMTFRAKAEGVGTLSVSSGQVLLNDGQGSDSLSGGASASFNISRQVEVTALSGQVEVTSASHPKQDEWYANKNIDLSWNRPSGAYGFSFALDNLATSEPDSILDTTKTTSKLYPNINDGIYFFHIKARSQSGQFGPLTNYKIQIDTVPPKSFNLTLNEANLSDVSSSPVLNFETVDELSGLAGYDIYLDGKIAKEQAASPYKYENIPDGPHTLKVIAKDKADNLQSAELQIIVNGLKPAKTAVTSLFEKRFQPLIYLLIATNALTLILFFIFWERRRKKEQQSQDPVAAIQLQIDKSLDDLKEHLNSELQKFSKKTAAEIYEKREEKSREVGKRISAAKNKIDKEIGQLKNLKKNKQ
jgi:hypothetical protein